MIVRRSLLACLPPAQQLAAGLVPLLAASTAMAADTVRASPPSDVSVTVYRAPHPQNNSLDLNELQGFALVTETRTVSISKGETRIRFEGVADGIEPQSAIITGLPEGVLEKNHDAHVLSPAALVTATLGRKVWLVRTNRKIGKSTQVTGTLVSDNDGILFKSPDGVEALRCSGLPETFEFDTATDATATPTLSALVRSPEPATLKVRLSYLAHGFDWMATYTATVSPDASLMDLGAWVTLGNGNGVSFNDAHTQVVAGRLNRQTQDVEPVDEGFEIVADCWPMETTSDIPEHQPYSDGSLEQVIVTANKRSRNEPVPLFAMAAPAAAQKAMVEQEQLGDLKLYRVPERASVTSRQIKQVRLLDRTAIPIQLIYTADLTPNAYNETGPLSKVLRARNDEAHHLGLPLPSGQVSVAYEHDGVPLVVSEAPLRDIATDEEVEIPAGESPDVQFSRVLERTEIDAAHPRLPLIPGVVDLRMSDVRDVNDVEVTNARNDPVTVELRLHLPDGTNVGRADHTLTTRNGLPTFQLTVPAQGSATLRFQTGQVSYAPVPHQN